MVERPRESRVYLSFSRGVKAMFKDYSYLTAILVPL